MQDAEPAIFWKGAIQHHHRAVCEQPIAGILFGPDHDLQRRLMILRIEIATDDDCRARIGVEQIVNSKPEFQRLPASLAP